MYIYIDIYICMISTYMHSWVDACMMHTYNYKSLKLDGQQSETYFQGVPTSFASCRHCSSCCMLLHLLFSSFMVLLPAPALLPQMNERSDRPRFVDWRARCPPPLGDSSEPGCSFRCSMGCTCLAKWLWVKTNGTILG